MNKSANGVNCTRFIANALKSSVILCTNVHKTRKMNGTKGEKTCTACMVDWIYFYFSFSLDKKTGFWKLGF